MPRPPIFAAHRHADRVARMAFLDCEASGLHQGSFPIEFGWSGLDLRPRSFLIRPSPNWTEGRIDPAAYGIHGIARSETLRSGIPPRDAALRLNEAFEDRIVVSDAPDYDAYWLRELFHEAGVPLRFRLEHIYAIAVELASLYRPRDLIEDILKREEAVSLVYPHPHRAGPDAVRNAALARAIIDDDFDRWVRAGHMKDAQASAQDDIPETSPE